MQLYICFFWWVAGDMHCLFIKFLVTEVTSNYSIVPMEKHDLLHNHRPNEVISQHCAEQQGQPLFGAEFLSELWKMFQNAVWISISYK